ncbi:hypothetical protein E2C01_016991 [Portunus trituberculatus]|uniref:Uncharacterized protein n=1 Tax=Portunus trituberculatus TaxID=210409 RepID=A0A5B7DS74_PORTR|nr:hypothetical protein [Portunus trituberculatus]
MELTRVERNKKWKPYSTSGMPVKHFCMVLESDGAKWGESRCGRRRGTGGGEAAGGNDRWRRAASNRNA